MTTLSVRRAAAAIVLALAAPTAGAAQGQNPSPMVESTRAHERLERVEPDGIAGSIPGPGGRDVRVFVPAGFRARSPTTLVIHFHGAAWIPERAVAALGWNAVSAVVNLGAGSTTYDRAFGDPRVLPELVDDIARAVSRIAGDSVRVDSVVLTAFSAGHGAVRRILREAGSLALVDAVLLLDGMHTSYVPEGTVLAGGGTLDTTNLAAFADVGRQAMAGEKRVLVTHSEIFPGTFASTTETADWLLDALGLERTAVLEWGPRGMQQLSEASCGAFELLGYAGNSAPDHVDHFHAMPEMLARLLRERDHERDEVERCRRSGRASGAGGAEGGSRPA